MRKMLAETHNRLLAGIGDTVIQKSRQHRMEASSRALVLPRRGFFSCVATVQKKSPGLGHGWDSGVV
jgi:hypothetical protein